MKYVTVPLLYLFFAIAAAFAGALGVVSLLSGETRYVGNVFRAMNRLFAAVLGFEGTATVSRECGRSNCRFCSVVCAVLSVVLEPDHCKKEL